MAINGSEQGTGIDAYKIHPVLKRGYAAPAAATVSDSDLATPAKLVGLSKPDREDRSLPEVVSLDEVSRVWGHRF